MPTRALEVLAELDGLGWSGDIKLVYEPIPSGCIPSELPALRKVLPYIHIFSPNHEEAGTFFGLKLEEEEHDDKIKSIESLTQRFLDEGAMDTVIIRSGKLGAYAKQRNGNAKVKQGTWTPAYHQTSEKVVDVTGAGNAFLVGCLADARKFSTSNIVAGRSDSGTLFGQWKP